MKKLLMFSVIGMFTLFCANANVKSDKSDPRLTEKELSIIEAEVNIMVEVTGATKKQQKQLFELKKEQVIAQKEIKTKYADDPEGANEALKPVMAKYFTGLKKILTPEQHEKLKDYWAKKNSKKKK